MLQLRPNCAQIAAGSWCLVRFASASTLLKFPGAIKRVYTPVKHGPN